MGSLAHDTEVHPSDGVYRATLSEDWRIWGPMGGYAASLALRAAAAEVEPGLRPASLSCQFFRPAEFGPVELAVETRRAGRRTAALQVRMLQHGADILDCQVWFAVEDEHIVHDHAGGHAHGDPDDHADISELSDTPSPFPFWDNFESRPVDPVLDWESYPGGEPVWNQWLRFDSDPAFTDPVLEACRLLVLADLPSFPAASRAHPGGSAMTWIAPNLDLAVQFHRLDGLGEWLLCSGSAPIAQRGLAGFRSEVWTRSGALAASGSGQLLIRPVRA